MYKFSLTMNSMILRLEPSHADQEHERSKSKARPGGLSKAEYIDKIEQVGRERNFLRPMSPHRPEPPFVYALRLCDVRSDLRQSSGHPIVSLDRNCRHLIPGPGVCYCVRFSFLPEIACSGNFLCYAQPYCKHGIFLISLLFHALLLCKSYLFNYMVLSIIADSVNNASSP